MGKTDGKYLWTYFGFFLFALSLIVNIVLWNNRSSIRESLSRVRNELQYASERNTSLEKELSRAEDTIAELSDSQRRTQDELERSREIIKRANEYIGELENQLTVSDQSLGRIEEIVDGGLRIVEEGRGLLQKGEN